MPDLIRFIIFGLTAFVIGHTATEKIKNERVASECEDKQKNKYQLRLFKSKELEELPDSVIISHKDIKNPFYISKSDSNDNFVWVRNIGGSPYELPNQLFKGPEDDIYLIGSIGAQFAFNQNYGTGIDQSFTKTAFIVQFDTSGKENWASFIYGLDVYRYYRLEYHNGQVIIEGYFDGFFSKRNVIPNADIYWRR